MRAFIVRPFGHKNGTDFDRVEKELIQPALKKAGFAGGTTVQFIQQGNIRSDMFEQLLIADMVVADISIHNANVFYELGIRHAFRDRSTFLIRSKGDEVPFDLKTDRYLAYEADNPGDRVEALAAALRATWDSQEQDSPVYQLLPGLEAPNPDQFLVVPQDFSEEVRLALAARRSGHLQLLAAEMDGFAWRSVGLRLIGNAEFKLKDWKGARATWEEVRTYDENDLEANAALGTVYQRLGDLTRSDQALERALQHRGVPSWHRAEIRALMGRNAKALWERDWRDVEGQDEMQKAALVSPHLQRSFDLYRRGFIEDRNHFYSGLNALAMITIQTELASMQPEVWEEDFETEEEAVLELKKRKQLRADLIGGVKLAIRSKRIAAEREERTDVWAEISLADLATLSSNRPTRVGRAYKKALAQVGDFDLESTRNQLLLYQPLGVLSENTEAALANIPTSAQTLEPEQVPPKVILFTGHRIDAEDRKEPRFPADKEQQAREMIREAVEKEMGATDSELLGVSGAACGGDILFHEVCRELGIETRIYLVLPKPDYIKASVAGGGPGWVERFRALCEDQEPEILSQSPELPRWLRAKRDYSIWQRSNLWMLHASLYISQDNLTMMALWNGRAGDGPGGTEDMVDRARNRGAKFICIDARKLVE
jgi:hypothetical protein